MPLITTESTYVKYNVDSRGMYNAYTLSGSEKKVQKELMTYNTDIIKSLYGGFGDTDKSSLYGFEVKQPNELNNYIMEQYYFPPYSTSYTIPDNAIKGDTYKKEYVKTVWATNYGGVKFNTTVRKIISWDIKTTPSYTTITFKLSSISTSGYIQINCSQSGPLAVDITCNIERISGNGIKRSYSLVYEKSNRMGGYQEFYVTEKPSRDDIYTIKSVYPTTSGNIKYEGYFLGITVH